MIQGNLPISRSLTLITSAMSFLTCMVAYFQVLGIRTRTSLRERRYYSSDHNQEGIDIRVQEKGQNTLT